MAYSSYVPPNGSGARRDSFSSRFSTADARIDAPSRNSMAQMHPVALQSGSVALQNQYHLPHNTQLMEDRVRALPSEPSAFSRQESGDDGNTTLGPFDSISNIGDRDNEGVSSYGGHDYANRDPYSNQSRRASRSYASRPRSGSAESIGGVSYNPRQSVSKLPLIAPGAPAVGYDTRRHSSHRRPGESDDESTVDGDNYNASREFGSSKHTSRAYEPPSYPPAPHGREAYDAEKGSGDNESVKDDVIAMMRGENPTGKRPHVLLRQIRDTTPLDQKIANHRAGVGVQARPWACWIIAVVLVALMIYELVKSQQKTGKAISTSPFNYMIGPSSELLINIGARFTGCMRSVPEITATPFRCLNDTSSSSSSTTSATCTLEDICGFGGFGPDGIPHQTFRFFTPIWLHVGVVHLLINGLVLLTSSAMVEKQMGTLKFLVIYIIGGVFGFILGANFALSGLASMGASGALFATHAAVLVDLVSHWSLFPKPVRILIGLIFEIVVGLGLGLIPGIDNFSHIGGFAIGLLLSICLLPSIHQTRTHRLVVYCLRIVSLVGAVVMFAVLLNNFYKSDPNSACEWCRYLSCWPTANNNHCKGTGLTMTSTSSSSSGGSNDGTIGSQITAVVLLLSYSLQYIDTKQRQRELRTKTA